MRTVGEKVLEVVKKIAEYKTEGMIEEMVDNFGRLMTDVERIDLVQNLNYALNLQFVD